MNAASYFFRLCRQRQLKPTLAANTRQTARISPTFQRKAFLSSSRCYALPVGDTTQSDLQTTQTPSDLESKTLFCKNIPFHIEKETVLEAFRKAGPVLDVHRRQKAWEHHNGGFCFVDFASHEDAAAALNAMNGVEIGGRPIQLEYQVAQDKSNAEGKVVKNKQSKDTPKSKKPLSKQDEEYSRTQPLVTGTVTRTGTMLKTVAVTTKHRRLDKYTQTHHVEEETELVHDPQGILTEGDVIKYQHFPPDLYAERSARGKTKVRFVLREVVTPFGTPVEERTPRVAVEQKQEKKTRRGGSKDKLAATTAL